MNGLRKWIVAAVLFLLVLLLRYPSLEEPFDNDSGANAYLARRIVRGEPLYGAHHPAHHLPAVYYTYALAFVLFGDSLWAVKFFLILWTFVTACVVYRLGALVDRPTGFLAATFYVFLSSHMRLLGTTAEIELFANLPRTAAILIMVSLSARRAPAWRYVFVGLCAAVAFLFKAVYLSPLAVAGFVLLDELWQGRWRGSAWRLSIVKGLWVMGGFLLGVLPVAIYFGALGLLPRLLQVFTLGQNYVGYRTSTVGFTYVFLGPFVGLALNNAALVIFSFCGLLMVIAGRLVNRWRRDTLVFYLGVWYLVSFVEAGITRVFFPHYYLLNVPPLALLAGWFLVRMGRDVHRQLGRRVAMVLTTGLVVVTLWISVDENFNYYSHYVQYKLDMIDYRAFILNGVRGGDRLLRVQELADYVKARTSPTDHIYYWSGDVQIYYLADRRCPIDIIWPIYAGATGPHQRIFSPRTKYVILGQSNNIPRPDWLYSELERTGYVLETVIQDQEVFRREE